MDRTGIRTLARSLATLVALGLVCLAAVQPAPAAEARVRLTEECSFKLLAGDGLVLKTKVRLTSIGGVPAVVKLVPGWMIDSLYPKAKSARTVHLDVREVAEFTVTRTFPHAPGLRAALTPPGRFDCASVFTVRAAKA